MTDNCRTLGHVRGDQAAQTFRPVHTPRRGSRVQPFDHGRVEFHGDRQPSGRGAWTHITSYVSRSARRSGLLFVWVEGFYVLESAEPHAVVDVALLVFGFELPRVEQVGTDAPAGGGLGAVEPLTAGGV